MPIRRFARLTNAFSTKFENHEHMVALCTVWYNLVRVHKTLRMSPALAANVTGKLWCVDAFVAAMDEVAPKQGRLGPHNKKLTDAS